MQDEWIAAWETERTTCHFHGGPVSECGDDERDWFPQRTICWPTAQLEAAKRRYAMLHADEQYTDGLGGWAKDASIQFPFHYSDGVSFWLSRVDLTPDDDFLGQSVAGEGPRDDGDGGTDREDHEPGAR